MSITQSWILNLLFFSFVFLDQKVSICPLKTKKISWKTLVNSEFKIGCWHGIKTNLCNLVLSYPCNDINVNWSIVHKPSSYKNSSELQHESDRSPLKSDTRQDYSPLSLLHIFAGFYCACGHYSVSNFRWLFYIWCRISPFSSKMPISWRQFLQIWFKHASEPKTVEYHFEKVRNYSELWLFIDFRACASEDLKLPPKVHYKVLCSVEFCRLKPWRVVQVIAMVPWIHGHFAVNVCVGGGLMRNGKTLPTWR